MFVEWGGSRKSRLAAFKHVLHSPPQQLLVSLATCLVFERDIGALRALQRPSMRAGQACQLYILADPPSPNKRLWRTGYFQAECTDCVVRARAWRTMGTTANLQPKVQLWRVGDACSANIPVISPRHYRLPSGLAVMLPLSGPPHVSNSPCRHRQLATVVSPSLLAHSFHWRGPVGVKACLAGTKVYSSGF
jgi:hypothetical protein